MKKSTAIILGILVLALTSCNSLRIEKRHYNGGFYVETGSGKKQKSSTLNSVEQNQALTNEVAQQANGAAEAQTSVLQSDVSPEVLNENPAVVISEVPAVKKSSEIAEVQENEVTSMNETTPAASEKNNSAATTPAGDVPIWVYVLLCLFIPPLAVYLKQGLTNWFWIDLILTIVGFGLFRFSPYLWGAGLAAVVIAFLVVFDAI